MLFFQVFFIILAAIFATGFFFAGVWLGWTWAIIFALFALISYFVSMTFKNALAQKQLSQQEMGLKDDTQKKEE
jgi:membrane protein implicated in regulation of membrane protease activity